MAGRPRTRRPGTRGGTAVLTYCDDHDMPLSDFAEQIAEMDASNFSRLLYDPDPNPGLHRLKRIQERTGGAVLIQWWAEPPE